MLLFSHKEPGEAQERKMLIRVAAWASDSGSNRSGVAPRRRIVCLAAVRGLKPTATIVVSLGETGRKCPNSSAGQDARLYGRQVACRDAKHMQAPALHTLARAPLTRGLRPREAYGVRPACRR